MALINYHTKCRVCGEHLEPIFDLGDHYLHGLFVFPDFQPPVAKIPTFLMKCDNMKGGCGLVQLYNSVDPSILYSRYGYRSSTNATMRAHLTQIALEADSIWSAKHLVPVTLPVFLDIGCNDGFLLKQLPASYKKIGIDPCDIGKNIKDIENFTFINDIFPTHKLDSKCDIVTMIACFYDVNDPMRLATVLYEYLNKNSVVVIEVSYWPAKMAQNAIDEVCHEHVCFYNFQDLEYIFESAGFKIFNAQRNDINGGSIQVWLTQADSTVDYSTPAFVANIQKIKFDELNLRLDSQVPYREFKKRCYANKQEIQELFVDIQKAGKTVHLYGASTKGNVLLQFLGLDSKQIPYAAERSKEKHGGKTLGTNIQMISEEESRQMRPDYYFVPIWSFKDEIIRREKLFIEGGGKLIFPLPKLEIISKTNI